MKKILFASLILMFANTEKMFAQSSDIILTNVSLVDTANLNSTVLFPFTIQNISLTDTITAQIQVRAREINYGNDLPDQLVSTPMTFLPGEPFSFPGNQLSLDQVLFTVGDNVVVIWPVVNGIPGDSILNPIKINAADGVSDIELKTQLLLAKISTNHYQIINRTNSTFSELVLFDLSGRKIEIYNNEEKQIQLNSISKGIYLLKIKLSDGRNGVFKISAD